MAKLQWIEERLQNWARWKLAAGSGSMAHVDLENADMPRDPYADAPIPITDCEASDTDAAVMLLPGELKITVLEYYIGPGGDRHKLARLHCSRPTMYARIERAHRMLADHFMAKQDKAKAERERVERVSAQAKPQGFYERDITGTFLARWKAVTARKDDDVIP